MGFGEIALVLNTKRTATIKCLTPCEVYSLERAAYETVLSLLPEEQRLGPIAKALNLFWELVTGPDGSRRQSVDFKTYLNFHMRTSKTLTSNSEMEEFDEDEERSVAQEDWSEDCARYKMKVTDSMSKPQYFSAMYQLVDLWSGDLNLSYGTFLMWIFDNIAAWNEQRQCYMFRKIDDVECVGDKFEEMKEEAREQAHAEEAAAEEAAAAAEEARKAHIAQQKEIERLAAAEAAEEERIAAHKLQRQLSAERLLRESDKLAADKAALERKLLALDDEEAELLRRLAAGNLTAEEEARIRKRLAEIEAERAALMAAKEQNEYASELAYIDQQLSALDDEEADLMRRLASGLLSPEEEAAVRARLKEIAAERERLLQDRHAAVLAQDKAWAEAEDRRFAAELGAIARKLSALDDEEAELLRRLASGELSPEEEAAIRARLEEIAEERAALLEQQKALLAARNAAQAAARQKQLDLELGELQRKLKLLDDEEAELLRRLQEGNLTPEEEAAIRKRLAEIAAERAKLESQIKLNDLAGKLADIDQRLAALDSEEAELLRRLAEGNLSPEEEAAIRKRLAEIEAERIALRNEQVKLYRQEERALRDLEKSGLTPEELARIQNRLQALTLLAKQGDVGGAEDGSGAKSRAARQPPREGRAERRARRAREANEARLAGRLATPDLTAGGSRRAAERTLWSAQATASAARENGWLEFDASRLPPHIAAEWHQLRSTLRNDGRQGRGRAMAWLGKAMRDMELRASSPAVPPRFCEPSRCVLPRPPFSPTVCNARVLTWDWRSRMAHTDVLQRCPSSLRCRCPEQALAHTRAGGRWSGRLQNGGYAPGVPEAGAVEALCRRLGGHDDSVPDDEHDGLRRADGHRAVDGACALEELGGARQTARASAARDCARAGRGGGGAAARRTDRTEEPRPPPDGWRAAARRQSRAEAALEWRGVSGVHGEQRVRRPRGCAAADAVAGRGAERQPAGVRAGQGAAGRLAAARAAGDAPALSQGAAQGGGELADEARPPAAARGDLGPAQPAAVDDEQGRQPHDLAWRQRARRAGGAAPGPVAWGGACVCLCSRRFHTVRYHAPLCALHCRIFTLVPQRHGGTGSQLQSSLTAVRTFSIAGD